MNIYLQSDLHLGPYSFEPPEVDASVVALVGDIGSHTHGLQWAIRTFGPRGMTILYVAGNHEFYDAELHGLQAELHRVAAAAREQGVNVWVLENEAYVENGVRFLGATLWTDYRLFGPGDAMADAMIQANRFLNDHRYIRCAPHQGFTPSQALQLHNESVAWLAQQLSTPFEGKTVVLSHHLPSFSSVSPRFQHDSLSAAFASRLDNLVTKADYWFHGHTHDTQDYSLGGTRVICNPRGYRIRVAGMPTWENPRWDPALVVPL